MLVLGIDTETTGVEDTDKVVEVGAIKYSVAADGSWVEMERYNALVYDGETTMPAEATKVNGITTEMLQKDGQPPGNVWGHLSTLMKDCSYIIAHNAPFDKRMLSLEASRRKMKDVTTSIPWLCSMADVEHPDFVSCRKLSHMAVDYGVAVDPSTLHRATADVELMGRILHARRWSVEKIIEYKTTPNLYVRMVVPKPWSDKGAGKDFAKSQGFSWQRHPSWPEELEFKNSWVIRIKETQKEAFKEKSEDWKYDLKLLHKEIPDEQIKQTDC